MTVAEAKRIRDEIINKENVDEDDFFMFTEAMEFLINELHDPDDMLWLGGWYYERKDFKLARKYYEMAAEYKMDDDAAARANLCLGYIFYYGRTGEPDYEKAFFHYKKAADAGSIVGAYKLADMYKNGYYVEKNYDMYVSIIEPLWPKVMHLTYVFDPFPEIATRLAGIRAKQGRTAEAVSLYEDAKEFLSDRLHCQNGHGFFGDYTIMKFLIWNLYELKSVDYDNLEFWDLYEVLKKPCTVTFKYRRKPHTLVCENDSEGLMYELDGKCFRTLDDFMMKGSVSGDGFNIAAPGIYQIEVEI